MRGAMPPLPSTSSWHGALLAAGIILPLPYTKELQNKRSLERVLQSRVRNW